jgi:diguanylate cyclase (GGDEF)-like protein/PAS domain S-box-containing protein
MLMFYRYEGDVMSETRPVVVSVIADGRYYMGILDALPERVVRYSLADLTILYCNAAWATGHQLDPGDVIGHKLTDFLGVSEASGLESQLARLGTETLFLADDRPRAAPNAPGQWVEWVDQYLPGDDGPEILAVGRDITGRHIAELNLAESGARFRDLADRSADVVWRFILEPTPHFDYVSPSIEKILGYPPAFFVEDFSRLVDILDDDGRAAIEAGFRGEPMPDRIDLRYRHANGSIVIGEMQISQIRGGLQGVGRDVTELRLLQANLAALALHDPLTGLANRRLLNELLQADLARTRRDGLLLAVAFLDLDGFKEVNDAYGHDAGDTVLCETARRLLSAVRSADVVARLGGDEFVIVYEPNSSDSANIVQRVDCALTQPIAITATESVVCRASIGVADTNLVGYDAAALLASADAAMYNVKNARRPSEGKVG